jgi:hypothetical protein
MKKYYCHQCAKQKGLIEDQKVRSQYQYDKHKKHTQIDSSYRLKSIFSDTSTSGIRKLHGQRDDGGRG